MSPLTGFKAGPKQFGFSIPSGESNPRIEGAVGSNRNQAWLYSWRFIQHRSTVKSRHHKGLEWYLWLYSWRFIQHRSTVKSRHHKGLEWYFLIEWGSQPGLEPTTFQLLWQVSSSLYRLHHQSCQTGSLFTLQSRTTSHWRWFHPFALIYFGAGVTIFHSDVHTLIFLSSSSFIYLRISPSSSPPPSQSSSLHFIWMEDDRKFKRWGSPMLF